MTVELQGSAGGRDAAAIAQSWSVLLAQLADRIVVSLADPPP
jgi:hypothetical protein